MCRFASLCKHFSLCKLKFFFQFVVRESSGNSQNITFCWFWLGKMDWNSLSGAYLGFEVCQIQWHLLQVPTISGSWKITISGINFTFCWFWLGKMHWNGLSGEYLWFCQIQYHMVFQVSVIGVVQWKMTVSDSQNFTFCSFWHWNCLSGAYLRFEACWIQWHLLQVPMISGSWKITILGDT